MEPDPVGRIKWIKWIKRIRWIGRPGSAVCSAGPRHGPRRNLEALVTTQNAPHGSLHLDDSSGPAIVKHQSVNPEKTFYEGLNLGSADSPGWIPCAHRNLGSADSHDWIPCAHRNLSSADSHGRMLCAHQNLGSADSPGWMPCSTPESQQRVSTPPRCSSCRFFTGPDSCGSTPWTTRGRRQRGST